MKSRTHYLTVRVVFDKKCTRRRAHLEVRDALKGQNFYPTWYGDEGDPEEFYVRGVKPAKVQS